MATCKYRVTAPSKVFGVEPGKTFEREIDPVQEARLIDSGAITKVRRRSRPATENTERATPASAESKE